MVIRRAAELQARSVEDPGSGGMAEEEVIRIGRELGLSGQHLAQALAEVRTSGAAERGILTRAMGEAVIDCTRSVRRDAAVVRQQLERYLLDHEYMVVQRRLPDRTIYVRASGVITVISLSTSNMFRRSPPLNLKSLAVSVQPAGTGECFVSVSTDLSGARAGYAAGGAALGAGVAGTGAAVLAIAVAPPAALVALPALWLAGYVARESYAAAARKARIGLESLLDRLEHGELPVSGGAKWIGTGF